MDTNKGLNIARGVFGIIAALLALITFILLGASMDSANFPGSNLKIAEFPDNDESRKGQYIEVFDGYKLDLTSTGCSNFVNGTGGLKADAQSVCKAATDNANDNYVKDWNAGWVVAPDCARTTDHHECAPFGSANALSIFGQLTFAVLAIQVLLYGIHTILAAIEGEKKSAGGVASGGVVSRTLALLKLASNQTKATIGLTVTWLIIGVALFIASAFAWESFCDKIDTGLGRRIAGSESTATYAAATPACAGTGCTMSFGGLFATFVVAVVWYRIPHILCWFGLLEEV